jgi:hypothetical protein
MYLQILYETLYVVVVINIAVEQIFQMTNVLDVFFPLTYIEQVSSILDRHSPVNYDMQWITCC